ncbi:MAG TPA: hypothetical protein PL059_13035 [Spirochaetota bacterium]|nr:hypothetical protein [Spirochaetota bacterium]HOJ29990.1 hypothetical protein [Spirochaetota bacterium]HOM11128.1 hypothetical protein [Spirochaetota bacterium]HPP50892.1 hypothetical protein [Spirochaetota bacterium]HXK65688.1 hypothetical protein [Spirochaetota bacterium]
MGEAITVSILVILALVYSIQYVVAKFTKPQQCDCTQCPIADCKERKRTV